MAKKLIVFAAVCILLFTLSACGSGGGAPDTTESAQETTTSEETTVSQPNQAPDITEPTQEATAPEETTAQKNTGGEKMRSLIIYFSWSGNTESVATEIANQTGADVFRLVPETPYTDSYNDLLDIAQAEQQGKARPAFTGSIEDFANVDVVYLGFPNWWADMPMIVYTFLDEYDLSGKTIAPFCTSGGSGFSNTISAVKSAEPNATVLDGLHVRDSAASNSGNAVSDWLGKLNLSE